MPGRSVFSILCQLSQRRWHLGTAMPDDGLFMEFKEAAKLGTGIMAPQGFGQLGDDGFGSVFNAQLGIMHGDTIVLCL